MRFLLKALLVLVLLGVAAAFAAAQWLKSPIYSGNNNLSITIPQGAGARVAAGAVADAVNAAGGRVDERLLGAWWRFSGQSAELKAGTYSVKSGVSIETLTKLLKSGAVNLRNITFVEGRTAKQFLATLAKHEWISPTVAELEPAQVAKQLGLPYLEGRLFPDTYRITQGESDVAVLKRAAALMDEQLAQAWAMKAADSPLKSPEELLILASIVEKETALDADRGKVAGVFTNRLKIGMRLQTDPTVIYGLGDKFDGNLRRKDLETDTPFNTYTRAGLPPTPIANPGKASLLAAAQPEATDAFYFVARGDGSSEFSATLDAHNRAVNRYQRGGK